MKDLMRSVVQLLEKGEDLVIASVIGHKGSTPRGTGAKIVIRKNGTTIGTIGGGPVEGDAIDIATRVFETGQAFIRNFDMNQHKLSAGNMVCGGKMDILVDFVKADVQNLEIFRSQYQHLKNRAAAIFITRLDQKGDQEYQTDHCLLIANGSTHGAFTVSKELNNTIQSTVNKRPGPVLLSMDAVHYWVEPLQFPKKLFLFGAGHVSRPTAALSMKVGFETFVLDDRKELVDRDHFPEPAELIILSDFKNCFEQLDIDADSYIVIVTRGHVFDKIVLAQALQSPAGYIGMIGSRKKRDIIYKTLLEECFTEQDLQRVHSPIGLDIGAETPEEIAVSITAELIKTRSGKR